MAQIQVQQAFGLLAMTFCIPSMAEGGVFGTQAIVQLTLTLSAYVAAYGLVQLVYSRGRTAAAPFNGSGVDRQSPDRSECLEGEDHDC